MTGRNRTQQPPSLIADYKSFDTFGWASLPVWPGVEIKMSPSLTISSLKSCHSCFYFEVVFFKVAQKVNAYLGNVSEKNVKKTFKNRPIWSHWS